MFATPSFFFTIVYVCDPILWYCQPIANVHCLTAQSTQLLTQDPPWWFCPNCEISRNFILNSVGFIICRFKLSTLELEYGAESDLKRPRCCGHQAKKKVLLCYGKKGFVPSASASAISCNLGDLWRSVCSVARQCDLCLPLQCSPAIPAEFYKH